MRALHSAALEALNQPHVHATQASLFAQFTRLSGPALSPVVAVARTVRLAGGDLRTEAGAAAPPSGCRGIVENSGLPLAGRCLALGDRRPVASGVIDGDGRNRAIGQISEGRLT